MRSNPRAVGDALSLAAARWPEQRTGQIIVNALRRVPGANAFNVEDHDLIRALMQYAGEKVPSDVHSDGEQGFPADK